MFLYEVLVTNNIISYTDYWQVTHTHVQIKYLSFYVFKSVQGKAGVSCQIMMDYWVAYLGQIAKINIDKLEGIPGLCTTTQKYTYR